MKRSECWLTFSEALEQYLEARAEMAHYSGEGGVVYYKAQHNAAQAAEHMDALTGGGDEC